MLSLPQMGCSVTEGTGQGVMRHMTQWALLVWSVTQVWVPGHTTLEQDSGEESPERLAERLGEHLGEHLGEPL